MRALSSYPGFHCGAHLLLWRHGQLPAPLLLPLLYGKLLHALLDTAVVRQHGVTCWRRTRAVIIQQKGWRGATNARLLLRMALCATHLWKGFRSSSLWDAAHSSLQRTRHICSVRELQRAPGSLCFATLPRLTLKPPPEAEMASPPASRPEKMSTDTNLQASHVEGPSSALPPATGAMTAFFCPPACVCDTIWSCAVLPCTAETLVWPRAPTCAVCDETVPASAF